MTDEQLLAEIDRLLPMVRGEVFHAIRKHGLFHSAHEGHSVIREELDELWDHVKANTGYTVAAHDEAKQIAAMGIKFMLMIRARNPRA